MNITSIYKLFEGMGLRGEMRYENIKKVMNRKLIFITGAPRSGTSLITKVIDAHPRTGILMESIFGNRRRHGSRSEHWGSKKIMKRKAASIFRKVDEQIVGNKVCTPDVWSAEDIYNFCELFREYKIVFVFRKPTSVVISRYKRTNYNKEYKEKAKKDLMLNFKSPFHAYSSSWRQSIGEYYKLKDRLGDIVSTIYYDDFTKNPKSGMKDLFKKISVKFDKNVENWNKKKHYDRNGELKKDLKYEDRKIKHVVREPKEIKAREREHFQDAIQKIEPHVRIFEERLL